MNIYADLVRYRDLFASLFRRDLEVRYKGSALGVVWSLANPLLLMAIYVLVFSVLWRVTDEVPHYALYVLAGLTGWLFFAQSLQAASRSMLDHAPLIRKTRFPRQLVPLAAVGGHVVTFAVMLVVVLAACLIRIPESRDTALLAIPLAALFVCFVAGIAVAVAAANVVFRDVEHLVSAALLPWFFLTPVLYRLSQLEDAGHETVVGVLRWANPVTPALEAMRAALWEGTLPRAADVLYLIVAAAAALVLGALVFNRVDDRIAVEL